MGLRIPPSVGRITNKKIKKGPFKFLITTVPYYYAGSDKTVKDVYRMMLIGPIKPLLSTIIISLIILFYYIISIFLQKNISGIKLGIGLFILFLKIASDWANYDDNKELCKW